MEFICEVDIWSSYMQLICGVHMWSSHVKFICGLNMWSTHVLFILEVHMWSSYVGLICGVHMCCCSYMGCTCDLCIGVHMWGSHVIVVCRSYMVLVYDVHMWSTDMIVIYWRYKLCIFRYVMLTCEVDIWWSYTDRCKLRMLRYMMFTCEVHIWSSYTDGTNYACFGILCWYVMFTYEVACVRIWCWYVMFTYEVAGWSYTVQHVITYGKHMWFECTHMMFTCEYSACDVHMWTLFPMWCIKPNRREGEYVYVNRNVDTIDEYERRKVVECKVEARADCGEDQRHTQARLPGSPYGRYSDVVLPRSGDMSVAQMSISYTTCWSEVTL